MASAPPSAPRWKDVDGNWHLGVETPTQKRQQEMKAAGRSRDNTTRTQLAAQSAGAKRDAIWKMTPAQRSDHLRSLGYNILPTAKSNRDTRSAGWAYVHGVSPKEYNGWTQSKRQQVSDTFAKEIQAAGGGSKPAPKITTPKGAPSSAGGANPGQGAAAGLTGSSGTGSSGGTDSSPLDSILKQEALLKPPKGARTPESAANVGTLEDPNHMAQLAGQSFAQAIASIKDAQGLSKAQTAQNIRDIGNWYKQVIGAVGVAAGRDSAATKAGVASITDITKALVGSLGGASNDASGSVAAVGAANAGAMQAIGTSQDQYNQDVQPLLQAEGAEQQTRQTALGAQAQHDFAMKMADLLAQKGQAEGDARTKASEYNTQLAQQRLQNLLGIRAANASAAQQDYNNKMGVLNAQGALVVGGAKAAATMTAAQARAAYQAGRLSIDEYNAITHRISATKPPAGKTQKPWAALSPKEQEALANQVTQGLLDANGKPVTDAPTFINQVHQRLSQLGRTDPRAYQYIWGVVAQNAPAGWSPYGNG